MDFLARDTVVFPENFWEDIDKTVVSTVRNNLVGRKILPLYGPLGAGVPGINVDEICAEEEDKNGIVKINGRQFVELAMLSEDFTLYFRDIEQSSATGQPMDLSKVIMAAQALAKKEDKLIFFGSEFLGSKGLLTVEGSLKMKKADWTVGENAFADIACALATFQSKGIIGRYSLVLSPDLYAQLHRVLPNLGMMEVQRISSILGGRLYNAPVLCKNKAILLCAEQQYMDIAVGKDIETGYLETKDFNHAFRILETAALRIKCKEAIVVFE